MEAAKIRGPQRPAGCYLHGASSVLGPPGCKGLAAREAPAKESIIGNHWIPFYIHYTSNIFLISSNDTSLSALSMRTNLTSFYYVDVILTFYIIQQSQSHEIGAGYPKSLHHDHHFYTNVYYIIYIIYIFLKSKRIDQYECILNACMLQA